jgi:hypothetical protein
MRDWRAGGGAHIADRDRRIAQGVPTDLPCDVCGGPTVVTNYHRDDETFGGAIECTRCEQTHGVYGPQGHRAFPIGSHFCTVLKMLPRDPVELGGWVDAARRLLSAFEPPDETDAKQGG